MTIEHGHANYHSDNYYTVGYWYLTEPHSAFPELAPVEERIIKGINTEGPTMVKESYEGIINETPQSCPKRFQNKLIIRKE